MKSYRESHTAESTAKNYDSLINSKFESRIYKIENIFFLKYLKKYSNNNPKILDFACGTGRKTAFLKKHYDDVRGFDISDAMLSVAREKYPEINFYKIDLGKDKIDEKFDVITAFRFFLNAELSLKIYILNSMKEILKEDGVIIFNIHYNKYSIAYLVQKLGYFIGTSKYDQHGESYRSMKKIIEQCGFKIIESTGYSYFLGCSFLRRLPFSLLKSIDLIVEKIKILKYFSKDIMFVIKME